MGTFIIGVICFGLLLFLISNLASKAAGKPIHYRGIGVNTPIAHPDTLDNIASEARKLVDKNIKSKQKFKKNAIQS